MPGDRQQFKKESEGNRVLILSIGEILWDVFAQAEHLGGAPLNFSAAAQRLGNPVVFLTAVGDDPRGRRAIDSMKALGLSTEFVQAIRERHTGTAQVSTDHAGNASYFIQRPAAFDSLVFDDQCLARIESLRPRWIYFGTLALTNQSTEEILRHTLDRLPDVDCFYDINLREGHWNLALVKRLSSLASIIKLNETEAETLFRLTCPQAEFSVEQFCRHWSSAYNVESICVTLGGQGCAIFKDNVLLHFGGFAVKVVDTVGAGDAFAAAFLYGYELAWPLERIAAFANALGALVAGRAGATPLWTVDECMQLITEQSGPEPW